jgi:rhomboid protease GluP
MNKDPLFVSQDNQTDKNRLISKILADFKRQYKLDLSEDPVALDRISEAVDQAFLDLETSSIAKINLPYISANPAGPIHLARSLTREDYETILPAEQHQEGLADQQRGEETAAPRRMRIELPDRKPVVTYLLLVITILIYGVQILTDNSLGYDLPAALGMKSNQLIITGQYWRLITPMFLHGSILHLGFNMYALYILGRRVERFFGSDRFLGLYLLAGIAGNMFSFFFTTSPSLGSSTAIFGLLGAEGIFIYEHRKLFGEQSRTALRQIIQVAAINLLIGLSPGIDNWGHVGGLIGGVIYTWFGGPRFTIISSPPDLRLKDQRSEEKTLYVFFALLIVIVCLVAWIIYSRS